jgi:hypothetical protein
LLNPPSVIDAFWLEAANAVDKRREDNNRLKYGKALSTSMVGAMSVAEGGVGLLLMSLLVLWAGWSTLITFGKTRRLSFCLTLLEPRRGCAHEWNCPQKTIVELRWFSSRGTLDIALLDGSGERFAIDNYFFQLCGSIVPSLVNVARQRLPFSPVRFLEDFKYASQVFLFPFQERLHRCTVE